jgi:hypothetical protein
MPPLSRCWLCWPNCLLRSCRSQNGRTGSDTMWMRGSEEEVLVFMVVPQCQECGACPYSVQLGTDTHAVSGISLTFSVVGANSALVVLAIF